MAGIDYLRIRSYSIASVSPLVFDIISGSIRQSSSYNFMKKTRFTVGSLFAGVGGICQAFKDADCQVLWANEIDLSARKTYGLNFPTIPLTEKLDVRDLKVGDVPRVDILTAGFPCQPFSQAGRARGFDDERGHLFFEITRLLEELQPQAYFLENVKTLVNHNGGKTFSTIAQSLKGVRYSFIPFVLRTSAYSNIPQGRERLYIVGFRNEPDFTFNAPIKKNDASPFQRGEAPFSSSFNIPTESTEELRKVRSFLEPETAISDDYYDDPESIIHQRVRRAVLNPDTVYQYRRWFVRENKSNVCPTLTANMGLGGHNVPIILNGRFPRRLTPKECFNLQGFRADFKLHPEVSRTHQYRQCGNSVVVPLVARIAREIVRVLDENGSR